MDNNEENIGLSIKGKGLKISGKAKAQNIKRKGTNWTLHETQALLEKAIDMQLSKLIDGKKFRHADIYKALEDSLQKQAILKDKDQIKLKLKKLKLSYNECKKKNRPSGAGRTEIPFYELLDTLYGERPCIESNLIGVDTLELEDIQLDSQFIDENVIIEFDDNLENPASTSEPTEHIENNSETIVEVNTEHNTNHIDPQIQTEQRRNSRKSGGKMSYSNLLDNFAEIVKTNQLEVMTKIQVSNQKFLSEEFKRQRRWEEQMTEKQFKFQNEQMKLFINVLNAPNKKLKFNENISSDSDAESLI